LIELIDFDRRTTNNKNQKQINCEKIYDHRMQDHDAINVKQMDLNESEQSMALRAWLVIDAIMLANRHRCVTVGCAWQL